MEGVAAGPDAGPEPERSSDEPELLSAWLTDYDYPNRLVTRTRTSLEWTGIRRDADLSDPDGAFDVFVAHRPHQARHADGTALRALPTPNDVVKIVARLDGEGDFERPHPDFDPLSIGSPTIWPFKVAGERFGLDRWVWASREPPFRGPLRAWSNAHHG